MTGENPLLEQKKSFFAQPLPAIVGIGAILLLVVLLAMLFIRVPTQNGESQSLWQSIFQNNPTAGETTIGAGNSTQGNQGSNGENNGNGAGNGSGKGTASGGAASGTEGGSGASSPGSSGPSGEGETGSCGNGLCDAAENCLNCESDCGECWDNSCTDNGGNCQAACGTGYLVFPGGLAQCQPNHVCCIPIPSGGETGCGNNILEDGEVCECGPNFNCGDQDDELNGQTCVSQGFQIGSLYCNATCTGFDVTKCFVRLESGDGKGGGGPPI